MKTNHISQSILTIGPKFTPPKGGIEMVLYTYSKYFPYFQYLSSWKKTNKIQLILYFLKQIFIIITTLSKNKNIKIIHIHGSYNGSIIRKFIILIISKYLFNKIFIYHSHGSKFSQEYTKGSYIYKFITKFLIEKSDAVICLSQNWESYFDINFNCKTIFTLNNIIDNPTLQKKTNTHNKQNIVKFLFLGLIGERKGVYDLINLVIKNRIVFENKLEIHIGGNGEINKLNSIVNKNDLANIVKFHGWVSGSKKIELLNDCDVFILPSYNEGLPIAILEAMSYSMPIISTSVGGIPDIVKNGVNGFIITPGNLEELNSALLYFISNTNSINIFGDNSKNHSNKHLPDFVIPELENIYKSLLYK